ncbi:MAG: hypothetical protein ACKPKO_24935, partial [Candidatus Fonsibacter sp.]
VMFPWYDSTSPYVDTLPIYDVMFPKVDVMSLTVVNVPAKEPLPGWLELTLVCPTGNGSFAGTLTNVGDITSTTGNITSYIGNKIYQHTGM